MAQTTYNLEPDIAFAGMLATSSGLKHVDSKVSEESASFPHGVGVVAGSTDAAAVLPSGAAKLLGVAQHSHFNDPGSDDLNLVDPERMFNVLHVGRLYVQVEDAVTPASPVFIRTAAAAAPLDQTGRFAGAAGAGLNATTGLRFVSSAAAEGLAILEIDADAEIL